MNTFTVENKEIKFFDLAGDLVAEQKTYPNGDLFDTDQEASEWAESYLAADLRTSSFGPKMGKTIDPIALITDEEIAARKASYN
jgi:hypothetical protein